MRIEPHANLTITLLERHTFGTDRLQGSVPRRVIPIPHLCDAEHLRCASAGPVDCAVLTSPCPSACPSSPSAETPGIPGPPGIPVPTDEQLLPPAPPATVGLVSAVGTTGNLFDVMA